MRDETVVNGAPKMDLWVGQPPLSRYNKETPMDRTVRKLASFEEMKDEEYRYWQSVPPAERIAAIFAHSVEAYRMKGIAADGQGLKRTLVRFERPQR